MKNKLYLLLVVFSLVAVASCGGNSPSSDGADRQLSVDTDLDGVPDTKDNCPATANSDQNDSNSNGAGDVCDTTKKDTDGDGIEDDIDTCPTVANENQSPDVCTDSDSDGIVDANDNCPNISNPDQLASVCIDSDADGVMDNIDNCLYIANPDQKDEVNKYNEKAADGIGDVCQDVDSDKDGIADKVDNCPNIENADQANLDGDVDGDVCDTDVDGDLYDDSVEKTAGTDPKDANSYPLDTDNDGIKDYADTNADGDGYSIFDGDCNDLNKDIAPNKPDPLDDFGVDSNCDGLDGVISSNEGILVAPDGFDKVGCGVNIQTPCKSISYAIKTYTKAKYILVAVAKDGTEFSDNIALPANVSLRGGYCAVSDGYYVNTYAGVPATKFAVRKRDFNNCIPVINAKNNDPVLFIMPFGTEVNVVEGISFKNSSPDKAAVLLINSHAYLRKNYIEGILYGLYAMGTFDVTIEDNYLIKAKNDLGEAYAIRAEDGNRLFIYNNDIEAAGLSSTAIFVKNLKQRVEIRNNSPIMVEAKNSAAGVNIQDTTPGNPITISDNTITVDSNSESKITGNGVYGKNYRLINISGNTIHACFSSCGESSDVSGVTLLQPATPSITQEEVTSNIIKLTKKIIGKGIYLITSGHEKIRANNIEIDEANKAYAVAITTKSLDSDTTDKTTLVTGNNIKVNDSPFALGVYFVKTASSKSTKPELVNLAANKIFLSGGNLLRGIQAVNMGVANNKLIVEKNISSMGEVFENGRALFIKDFTGSVVSNNLFYGGWLNTDLDTNSVAAIESLNSPTEYWFNHILGGTIQNAGTVTGFKTNDSAPSPVKMIGNIISAMSVSPLESSTCTKYGIYSNAFDTTSTLQYNYFNSEGDEPDGKFNNKDYYGACFVLKSISNNKEEQNVGNLNTNKADYPNMSSNMNSAFKMEGDYNAFSFYSNEEILNKITTGSVSSLLQQLELSSTSKLSDILGNVRFVDKADIGAVEFGDINPVEVK